MMKINVIRGGNCIGGNIIELSTEKTKILLDAGCSLDGEDYTALPDIPALFSTKGYDAIIISHYHADHMGLVYHAHKDIPVYIGRKSFEILRASDSYLGKQTIQPSGFLEDSYPFVIGDIKFTPFLCDHSAYDSYMILCEADGEKVLYTGDFRANGRKCFQKLLRKLPKKIDTLLCEGTTLSRQPYESITEAQLEEKATEVFKNCTGPIFIFQSAMNIDRVVTMYRAAKRARRVFLEDTYMARVTAAAGDNIPNPTFNDVFAFLTTPKRYQELVSYHNRIGLDSICTKKFVMCVRASMIDYITQMASRMDFHNGILIYSMWKGYRKQKSTSDFIEKCEQMGLKVLTLHTSGHADEAAIKELIQATSPENIIPVHTEMPDWFIKERGDTKYEE